MSPIPLALLDGDTLCVDNTSMEKQQTCPRAAEYGLCRRRRTSGDRVALKFGGIAHQCLETRYRFGKDMYVQDEEVQAAMVQTAYRGFEGYRPPEDDYRTLDRMIDLVAKYGVKYPYEDFQIVKFPDGRPFIEVPFAMPLATIRVDADFWVQTLRKNEHGDFVKDGVPTLRHILDLKVIWIGRIDMVYQALGGIFVMDHKTSSIATNMSEFEISHQFYGYVNAVEDMLATQVSGIVINRIVCRKPTRTGIPFDFERKLITVQRGLVTDWRSDMVHIITDFLEMVRRGYMPKHTQWCVGKFGACEFHKVCTLDTPEQREMMLMSGEYEENVWNPLK